MDELSLSGSLSCFVAVTGSKQMQVCISTRLLYDESQVMLRYKMQNQNRALQRGQLEECDELNHLNRHEAWNRFLHVLQGLVGRVRSLKEMMLIKSDSVNWP